MSFLSSYFPLISQGLLLFFNIPALPSGKIDVTLFEQGFFYGVNAGGAEYILKPCFMGNTGGMKSVFGKTAKTVFAVVGVGFFSRYVTGFLNCL